MTVIFNINFDESNKTDIALARNFLVEFPDSKKNVKNSPTVMYYDKQVPEELTKNFPGNAGKKVSNGYIAFSKCKGV